MTNKRTNTKNDTIKFSLNDLFGLVKYSKDMNENTKVFNSSGKIVKFRIIIEKIEAIIELSVRPKDFKVVDIMKK